MKFENFLLEYGQMGRDYSHTRSRVLSMDEAISLIKTNCKKSLEKIEKRCMIFRATPTEGRFLLSDPTKGEPRYSSNTYNYMTLLMDNLPSWSSYPKRSKSLVCTTDPERNQNWNESKLVFPYDNAKIGICPEADVWDSFYRSLPSRWNVNEFNSVINDLLRLVQEMGYIKGNFSAIEKDWKKFKKALETIEDGISEFGIHDLEDEMKSSGVDTTILDLFRKSSIINELDKRFGPVPNGFQVVSPGNFNVKDEVVEVWIGNAPAVLINFDFLTSFNSIEMEKKLGLKKGTFSGY